jgi:aldehyde dehydrogenase (NAD+)
MYSLVINLENYMNKKDYHKIIVQSRDAQTIWNDVPAPIRGELIRLFGNKLREHKEYIAKLITQDSKKIYAESLGEVQEAIDMCDFGVGLSRQLYGATMGSERQDHSLKEIWHPLGIVGVISAFNFPCAVWAWNHILAIVCGNSVIWKPSPKSTQIPQAIKKLWDESIVQFLQGRKIRYWLGNRFYLQDLLQIVEGGNETAEWLADDTRIKLLSATGSTQMGKALAPRVSARLGRGLYELGGNNAMVVSPTANLELAIQAIMFSAVGTAGQRCTTLRRLIVQQDIYDQVIKKLLNVYQLIPIGDPMDSKNLMGPLIDINAVNKMQDVLQKCRDKGYTVHGGEVIEGCYVRPAIVETHRQEQCELISEETFAPILYVFQYFGLDNAIRMNNIVKQGLSSSIFTNNLKEAEWFTSATGSDCGIVNVNIGPSGAEIGGAFGGEKDTGGGRESGSDAWKQYMRRVTITTNYGSDLPLAQGIKFDV